MSVNKLISKICNLSLPLRKKDPPSPRMWKEVFQYLHSRIKKSKTGTFRFTKDETQILLTALDNAIEHARDHERLSELEREVHEARRALAKYGRNDPSGKGYREMARIIGAPRKGKDWSDIFCYFSALEGTDDVKAILIRVAIKYKFPSPSPLIKELRKRYDIKGLPSHDSKFAHKSIREHKISKK